MLREAFADLDDWISGARGENGTAQYGEYTSLPSATILWRRWEGHTCCVLQSYVAVEAAEGPMASPCYRGWCDGLSGHHHATIEEAVSDLARRLIRDEFTLTNEPVPEFVPDPLPKPNYGGEGIARDFADHAHRCRVCGHAAWLGNDCVYCLARRFADIAEKYGRPMRVEVPDPADAVTKARRAAKYRRRLARNQGA